MMEYERHKMMLQSQMQSPYVGIAGQVNATTNQKPEPKPEPTSKKPNKLLLLTK